MRPWDSLNDEEKRLFSRMAEVFAGFLSYTDAQIGRILDYLEESGQLDNTIIVVISDNGASGEGGPNGSVNEVKFFNGYIDTVEESMRFIDHLGGPETYNHYPIGWAMAFNTPYKLFKRYASHEGGIADTAIISWPNGIEAHGEVRDNYVNVCDITPTVYDLLGHHAARRRSSGIAQKPLDGVSFKVALDDPARRHRQGDAVLHDAGHPRHLAQGLVRQHRPRRDACRLVALRQGPLGAVPHRGRPQPVPRPGRRATRTSSRNSRSCGSAEAGEVQRAAAGRPEHPGDADAVAALPGRRPRERTPITPAPPTSAWAPPSRCAASRSSVLAEVTVDTTGAEGVIFKHGGAHGGHVLFIQDGRLHYVYNFLGEEEQQVSSSEPCRWASTSSASRYARTGTVEGSHTPLGDVGALHRRRRGGVAVRREDPSGNVRARRREPQRRAQHRIGGVARYKAPFPFTGGTIAQVNVDVSGKPYVDLEREFARAFAKD